jgi:transcriptional regulator with XRE-family HTH domain
MYLHRTGHSLLIGQRLRRMREARGLSQGAAIRRVKRPGKDVTYSQPLLSRMEAGYTSTPLYVYLQIADVYRIDPGRLLGPEEAVKEAGEAEMALIEFIRQLRISPAEAMARLARAVGGEARGR